jgi:hypothetical protein
MLTRGDRWLPETGCAWPRAVFYSLPAEIINAGIMKRALI